MTTIRKRETFEAKQFTDLTAGDEIQVWSDGAFKPQQNAPDGTFNGAPYGLLRVKKNGEMGVRAGDWVVRFPEGKYRAYQDAHFHLTFEIVP